MGIEVKVFDEEKAKEELKKCPKIVRDYVNLLENQIKMSNETTRKAITALQAKNKPRS